MGEFPSILPVSRIDFPIFIWYTVAQIKNCTRVRYFCVSGRGTRREVVRSMADTVETKPEEQKEKPPIPFKGGPGLWTALGAAVLCLAALVWSLATRPAEPPADSASTGDVSVVADTVPPQLLGVQDLTVAMGGTVSYRDGQFIIKCVDINAVAQDVAIECEKK